jgi:hypothetical protein
MLIAVAAPARLASAEPSAAAAEPSRYYHFSRAKPGLSMAGVVGAGLTARSLVGVGYGQPHWLWAGAHVQSALSTSFAAQAAGVRLVAPIAELVLQGRRTASYSYRFLGESESYEPASLTAGRSAVADYDALEISVTFYLPSGPGITYGCVWFDRLYRVPTNQLVFDEITRAVVKGPWLGSEQLAYLLALDTIGYQRIGPIAEHVWSARADGDVIRVGLAYFAQFTEHLGMLAYVTEPLISPDSLGLWTGAGGNLELRYAWSSTDPARHFP